MSDDKPQKKIKHFNSLDSLRGIAVLGVIFVHTSILLKLQGINADIGFTGQRGVQLFYLISAFTIFYSMDLRTKEELHPTRNFFIRRFFRIAPLYYFAIILNLIYQWATGTFSNVNFFNVGLGFLFLNGFRASAINSVAIGGWSIAIESTFYVLAPFIYKYINDLKKAYFLFIISSITIYYATYHYLIKFISPSYKQFTPEYREFFTFLFFPIQFPIFCMGILTYMLWKEWNVNSPWQLKSLSVSRKKVISIGLLSLSFFIMFYTFPFNNGNFHLTSTAFIFLILALIVYEWPLFVNRITNFLGRISFSIYLMHFFVINCVSLFFIHFEPNLFSRISGRGLPFLIIFVIITFISSIVSYITFKLIETPGINLGKKLISTYNKK